MDPNYKPLQQQADRLHHKFQDIVDDRSQSLARSLESECREVREDIERNKAPRAVEDRIKRLQQSLRQAKSQATPALSPDDADMLFDAYESLRESLRRLPNY